MDALSVEDEIVERIERAFTGARDPQQPLRTLPVVGSSVIYIDKRLQTDEMIGYIGKVLSVRSEDSTVEVAFSRPMGIRRCFMESLSYI